MDDVRSIRGKASGDQYSDWIDGGTTPNVPAVVASHPMDSDEMREEHKKLLNWYYLEREKQSANRLEMAMDADFYDGIQWAPDDAAIVRDRGQMPLVYNEVAPMVDWLIGTERRTRADWKVLPRAEDDVDLADVKTKVLKYVSDINQVPYARSRAFSDAVKVGVGWMDDGARDDPTQDVLYSKYEDWRNVLWDSSSYELNLSDARYIFRWRWVDEDVAMMMFPGRANEIRRAVEDSGAFSVENEEDSWYLGNEIEKTRGTIYASGAGVMADATRRRIKLIECQYRKPTMVNIVASGPLKGAFFSDENEQMAGLLASQGGTLAQRMMMRVHFSVFTEADMISCDPSQLRHNNFGLTPLWCYRRSRDRLPYGVVRRVRDIQQDLNKRASKALFMLNTNQIFAEEGATENWQALRDEVDRPDGNIVTKAGKKIEVRRDTDAATGQIQMMTLAAQSIQKTGGVNNENLGRATNAVSGAAIEARQQQGAVGTTEPFDNLRLAMQCQGEKQLSLVEQFYTEQKVIRLTGAKGAIEWVKINQPEEQADGSVRYLNDITASQADFIVAEQDYAGTLRQVMFDSLNKIAMSLPPEVSLRMLTIAYEFSDLPNKDEIVKSIREITGERDPNKELTPEEMQQQEDQLAAQAEAMQFQREQALLTLEESRAKVRELNAKAAQIESQSQGGEGMPPEIDAAIRNVQAQAADQIDTLAKQLQKAQSELANRTLEASTAKEVAEIDADTKIRVAEIQDKSDKTIAALEKRMESLIAAVEKRVDEKEAKDSKEQKETKPVETPAPAPAPVTVNLQIDAKAGTVKKTITVEKDKEGNITGATAVESEE